MAPIDRECLPGTDEARELADERRRNLNEVQAEAAYSRSEGYVAQTQAALKDHLRHQQELDAQAGRDSLWDRIERGEKARDNQAQEPIQKTDEGTEDDERLARILDDHDRDRRKDYEAAAHEVSGEHRSEEGITSKFDNVEMTEAQQQRMQRLLDSGGSGEKVEDDLEPDRQREVPGGGRTRNQ